MKGQITMYKIYKHTLPNGKVYIGQTSKDNAKERWMSGWGYYKNEKFFKDIVEYGWRNISHEILEEVEDRETALIREAFYINIYDSANPAKGYNIYTNYSLLETPEEKREREQNNIKQANYEAVQRFREIEYQYLNKPLSRNDKIMLCAQVGAVRCRMQPANWQTVKALLTDNSYTIIEKNTGGRRFSIITKEVCANDN